MSRLKTTVALLCCICLVCATTASPALAADSISIEQAITDGVAFLASTQNPDGSFGGGEYPATTAFVLVKLQDRATQTGFDPFDPAYQYQAEVVSAWDYLFSVMQSTPLSAQDHTGGASGTIDNPDADGDGVGVFWDNEFGGHDTYTSSLCLLALASSGDTNRVAPVGGTYGSIAQDVCDYLAFSQVDMGVAEGGWQYEATDNGDAGWADNSNGGYAVLGLAAGENFGCTIPAWVKTELNAWIGAIQNPVNGGSSYTVGGGWENELKTGNLIFQMKFVGDDPSTPRFQNAMDYIETQWQSPDPDPGWGYSLSPAEYQAMFCLMKGFEYSGISQIDLNGDGTAEHDWYAEFSDVLVAQQNADGSWPGGMWGGPVLSTCWALLTLEGIPIVAPPPNGGLTVEEDCFTEQEISIPLEVAFTIGHKLKVSVSDTSINLGEKLLPGDEGAGSFIFKVWSNDDVECAMNNTDFTGDDKGVNDEDVDVLTCPDGVVATDWGPEARYDEDEGAPFTIGADRMSIALNNGAYTKGSWQTISTGPTGDTGVTCNVALALDPITYADHAGYYTSILTLDVRQF